MARSISVSIGICAYNEEKNIGKLLEALLEQRTKMAQIKEIYVISSGSTDCTDEIVKQFCQRDSRIKLLPQERRMGKASAINLFLDNSHGEVLVLESGDTIPLADTIETLVAPFADPKVGMTGGHPIPVNDRRTFIGFAVHLLWELHHQLALTSPKLGELVAFRSALESIPVDTAVDEACIEAKIREKGLRLMYIPDALVYNKGPENAKDFIKQRRRIYAGHLHLLNTTGYSPSSMCIKTVLNAAFGLTLSSKEIIYTLGAMILEMYGRALGTYDFQIKKRNPYIWEMANTTKEVICEQQKAIDSKDTSI
jgi:poly-beta-1,6-N-acetyl-D-glucosamine synthase